MHWSKQIKEVRCNLQMSQVDFGARIGMTRQSIANWESGRCKCIISASAIADLESLGVVFPKTPRKLRPHPRLNQNLARTTTLTKTENPAVAWSEFSEDNSARLSRDLSRGLNHK
jgi:DNA-binding XRE family transcriptional regulator